MDRPSPATSLFSNGPPPTTAVAASRQLALTWTRIALIAAALSVGLREPGTPEHYFLWYQDLPVLVAMTAMLWAGVFLPRVRLPDPSAALNAKTLLLAAVATVLIGRVGVGLVFEHYTLSLDEAMADFDADIFLRGQLLAKIPHEWIAFAPALEPIYVLRAQDHWGSAYLPMNAVFRAMGSMVHARDWVNPIFGVIALFATFGVARQLWPEHPRRAVAAALLLGLSPQFLVMGMTSYAMPAHLALNTLWLYLFLKNRRLFDVAALIVGFVAVGLHQMLFHPMFVGFFILELWLARRWSRAIAYTAVYAVICLFWLLYWKLIFQALGVTPDAATVGAAGPLERIWVQLAKMNVFENLGLFAGNMVRFITWQSLLLAPLALLGIGAAIRTKGPLRSLCLGMLVTCLAMLALVPSQTHGWGYRYLHGFLGGLSLLAVSGWIVLTEKLAAAERKTLAAAFGVATVISTVIFVPLRAWQSYHFSHPFAASSKAIASSGADVVLLDTGPIGFDYGTLIRNDPFLETKPKVMLMYTLNTAQLEALCAKGKVRVFDAHDPAAKGMLTYADPPWAGEGRQIRAHLREIGCEVE